MSTEKKKEDTFDLEQQFILRLPQGVAAALEQDLQSAGTTLKDKLSIEVRPDMRHGTVRYKGQVLNAKILDLPTIVESLKTTDKKTLYKTADICQMMVCSTEYDSPDETQDSAKKKEKGDKKYQHPHGITPPMKNVRKRRFRKVLTKKYLDMPEMEKEVKRLFRQDAEAIDVQYHVTTEDDTTLELSSLGQPKDGLGEEELFGDVSTDDEGEESPEKSAAVDYSDSETSRPVPDILPPDMTEEAELEEVVSDEDTTPPPTQQDSPALSAEVVNQLETLKRQLRDIADKKAAQEAKIADVDNVALKQRFGAILESMVMEEEDLVEQYSTLSGGLLPDF